MQIRDISKQELEIIGNYGIVLLQFYKSSCEESELIKKEIEKISDEGLYFHAVRFNIEQDLSLASLYKIEKTPTLLMVKGEEILGRKESFMTAEEIHEWAHFSTIMGW